MKKILWFVLFVITTSTAIAVGGLGARWVLGMANNPFGFALIGLFVVVMLWLLWLDFSGMYADWQKGKQDGSRS